VLGHEIVHAAARHGAQAMQRGLLLQGALVVAGVAARNNDYSGLAVGAASIGAQLINQRHGREAELEADEYGMRYMSRAAYDPSAAVTLQETFVRLSGDRGEEGWLAGLFASHPPSAERVAQNRATAAALPPTGEMGREAYRAAIAPLLESQPAYEAHDDARAALAAGDAARAEELAQQAVRLLPGEAQFYGLLGDIDASQRRFDDAIRHYADAVARNDRFFYYRLQRGRAYRELGQRGPARADLEASVALLPTADAHLGLGAIAEREGDVARALEHYRAAAGASGPAGEAAAEAVVRLDLPANPAQYIGIRTAVDSGGRLVVEVANTTRVSIRNVRLAIRYADSEGAVRTARPGIADTLAPGAVVRVATGLGPFTSAEAYDVAVESAQVATQ
jgi:predicted Zn-dependent protease